MFQYAAGRAVAIKNHTDLHIDMDWFLHNDAEFLNYRLDYFNIQANIAHSKQKPFYQTVWKNKILNTLRYPILLFCKIVNPNHVVDNPRHPIIHK